MERHQQWSAVSIRLTKQMLVSGMMSLREMASSLLICSSPTASPKLKERGRGSSEPFNDHAMKHRVILTKACVQLYLRKVLPSASVLADLCTSTPTDLYQKKKQHNINHEQKKNSESLTF